MRIVLFLMPWFWSVILAVVVWSQPSSSPDDELVLFEIVGKPGDLQTYEISEDGSQLFLGGRYTNTVEVWRIGERLVKERDLPGAGAVSLLHRADKLYMLNAQTQTIDVFDTKTWEQINQFNTACPRPEFMSAATGVHFTANPRLVISGLDPKTHNSFHFSFVDTDNDSSEEWTTGANYQHLVLNHDGQSIFGNAESNVTEYSIPGILASKERNLLYRATQQHFSVSGFHQALSQIHTTPYWIRGKNLILQRKGPPVFEGELNLFVDRNGKALYHMSGEKDAHSSPLLSPAPPKPLQLNTRLLNAALPLVASRQISLPEGVARSVGNHALKDLANLALTTDTETHLFLALPHLHGRFNPVLPRPKPLPGTPANYSSRKYTASLMYAKIEAPPTKAPGSTTNAVARGGFDVLPLLPSNDLAPSEDGTRMYFAHEGAGEITEWNVIEGKVQRTLKVPAPNHIIVRGNRLFALDRAGGKIHVLDIKTGAIIDLVPTIPGGLLMSAPRKDAFDGTIYLTGKSGPEKHWQYVLETATKGVRQFGVMNKAFVIESAEAYFLTQPISRSYLEFYEQGIARPNGGFVMNSRIPINQTSLPFQYRPGSFWFSGNQILHGEPPLTLIEEGLIMVPDLNRDLFYQVTATNVVVHSMDRALQPLASFPVRKASPGYKLLTQQHWTNGTVSHPVGTLQGEQLHIFLPNQSSQQILYGTWHGKNTENLESDASVVGRPVEYFVLDQKAPATTSFTLMNGPEGGTLGEGGSLDWTPSPSQIGTHNFKVRVKQAGKTSFKRFSLSVVAPAKAADSSWLKQNPAVPANTDQIALSAHTFLARRPKGAGTFVVSGRRLRWLGPDGTERRQTMLPRRFQKVYESDAHILGVALERLFIYDKDTLEQRQVVSFKHRIRSVAPIANSRKCYVTLYWPSIEAEERDFDKPFKPIQLVDESTGGITSLDDWSADEIHVTEGGEAAVTSVSILLATYWVRHPFANITVPEEIRPNWFATARIGPDYQLHVLGTQMEPGANVQQVSIAPDGSELAYVASAYEGEMVRDFKETATGPSPIGIFPITAPERARIKAFGGASSSLVEFHPTLPIIATYDKGKFRFQNRKDGSFVHPKFRAEGDTIKNVIQFKWSGDGKRLILFGQSGKEFYVLGYAQVEFSTLEELGATEPNRPFRFPSVEEIKAGPSDFGQAKLATPTPFTDGAFRRLQQASVTKMRPVDISANFKGATVGITTSEGTGTGFFISDAGHILTCQHVLNPGEAPKVVYRSASGQKVEATAYVIKANAAKDIALLAIKPSSSVTTVRFESPRNLEMGEAVYTIGNPGLGDEVLEQTMTEGIVSSTSRKLAGTELIQTSAAVNPGSSGSPLYNSLGNVIGMVVQKGEIEGVGFAVPTKDLISFLRQTTR